MLRYKGTSDLYQFFSVISKYQFAQLTAVVDAHLPPKQSCPFAFLQELAEKKKKFILRPQVPAFRMPTWPELSVKKLWPGVQLDEAFKDYFPNTLPKGKLPDKQFFWGVIFTIKPGYAKRLVKDAIEQRNELPKPGEEDKAKLLRIDAEYLQRMLEAPIFMSKSARH